MLTAIALVTGALVVWAAVVTMCWRYTMRRYEDLSAEVADVATLGDTLQAMQGELEAVRAELETADPAGLRERLQRQEKTLSRVAIKMGLGGMDAP